MPFAAAWMDLDIIMVSEVSQTEKDNYHMVSHVLSHSVVSDSLQTHGL